MNYFSLVQVVIEHLKFLFNPELIGEECEGIHEILSGSIQRSDMDLRRTLYQNIVLSGGSTLFRGKLILYLYLIKYNHFY